MKEKSDIPPLFALSYMAEAAHDGVDRTCQFTLANHIGQTCNTSSQSVATPRSLRFPNLPDRGSGGKHPRWPQGAKLRPAGQLPPHLVQRPAHLCTMRRPGGIITAVIPLSLAKAHIYPLTLVSSNAPKARSDAFCASVRPLTPVILSRSYGRSRRSVWRC